MPSGLIATNLPAPNASPFVPGAVRERLSIFVPSRVVTHHHVFWSLLALPMKAKTPLPAAPLRNQKAQPGTSAGTFTVSPSFHFSPSSDQRSCFVGPPATKRSPMKRIGLTRNGYFATSRHSLPSFEARMWPACDSRDHPPPPTQTNFPLPNAMLIRL